MMNWIKNNKRWVGIGITLLLVGLAGLALSRGRRAGQQAQAQTGDIVTVFVGNLSASATASGQVEAQRTAALSLSQSGTVAEVLVEVGDTVEAGDPLLRLETADLQRDVDSARQALAIQEANLELLLAPPTAADLAAADADVSSARLNLEDLLDGPNEADLAAAEANLRAASADVNAAAARRNAQTAAASPEEIRAAELALELAQQAATQAAEQHSTILVTEPNQFLTAARLEEAEFAARTAALQANADLAAAQAALDALLNGDNNAIASSQGSLARAVAARDAAQAQLDLLLQGPTATQIATAESQVAQAEAALDRLQSGPTEAQRVAAEVQVEQARIARQRAENTLAEATLTAPFSGVVTAVNISAGETANGILIELVDTSSLEVVLAADEVDIGDITVGQPASITLESWPGEEITAAVAAIAPQANAGTGGLVTYDVFLELEETALPVRVGMTANAQLITSQREDVLLAANAAINADRAAGTFTVNRIRAAADGNQTVEEVPVTIGLRDGDFTQILSGVTAGDELLIGNAAPVQTFGPGNGPPDNN